MKLLKVIYLLPLCLGLCWFFSSQAEEMESYVKPKTATATAEKYPQYPQVNYAASPLIQKGEYLAKLGDCIACHTKAGGAPFSGGFTIETPFGNIITPNLTPDKKTGIGNWTEEQFIHAMRDGISPHGKYYYPAFPYPYFNIVTNEDLKAIFAYLNAIPAVDRAKEKNQLMFPFSWRFMQLGWRILFFEKQKTGAFVADNTKSPEWNRGKYLVEGLGHCGMCHTQMHTLIFKTWVLGAPIKKYHLAGAFVQGYFAPNITRANLKDTPIKDLDDVFLRDRLIGGGEVQGPMAEANHDSLQYLTLDDIKAIATYLKTVQSEEPPKEKVGTGLAAGKKIFDQYCAGCHLTGAGGAPKMGDEPAWSKLVHDNGLNLLYKNAIQGIGGMPPKGTCMNCSDQEIQDAVQYIVEQSKPGVGQLLGEAGGKPPKPLTLEDGKNIYERYCQSCHNGSYVGAPKLGDKQAWKPLLDKGIETLILNSLHGYNNMPPRGSCADCSDAEIQAAVVYMVEQGKTKGDYRMWLGQ